MPRKLSLLTLVLLIITSILFGAGCGTENKESTNTDKNTTNEKSYAFRLAHITPATHGWHKTAEKFNEELMTRSGGRMKVDIYPSSQLGSEADMVQQVEQGTLDFAFISNAYMATRVGPLNGWFMPFLFADLKEAGEASKSDVALSMLKELESQGLIGMGYGFAGNRHILMKQGSINSPNDLKGKKLRVMSAPAMIDFWNGVGVGPTPMPLPEVYTSLQTGVIDGVDIDLDALVTLNLYETGKDLTFTNHMVYPSVAMMSQSVSNSLSAEDNQIVREAMAAALDWGLKDAIEREANNLATVKSKGLKITELGDYSEFNDVKNKIQEKYSSQYPLIKSFIEKNQ